MKDYLKIIFIHIIGFVHLWIFLRGFFDKNESYFLFGGTGLFIFIYIMIIGQPRNQNGFLFSLILGSLIGIFISKWYKGFFWVSALFSIGQIPGFIHLIRKSKDAIYLSKIENPNQQISLSDSIPIAALTIIPYIVYILFI